MTYYLYRRPDGTAEVNEYELQLAIFPGYSYIGPYEEKPDLTTMTLTADGKLEPAIQALRDAKRIDIERERDRRLVAPVLVYDGMNLDAAKKDKDNLGDVLARVNSTMAQGKTLLAQELVWKDHDNVIHPFPDIVTYKNWLDGFVMAFGERNTAVWVWSWQKKDQLDALTTADEITAFDPSS